MGGSDMNQNLTTEKQNVEFKESWRDEYLKWICGFANAQGGTLYIGVKDNGEVCGVENPKRLMEEIPNKARDVMGVFVEVNLLTENGLDYLEIKTEKYSFPVSYRGKFYRRCGATNQELKGAAMYRFLLRSQNLTWDKLPEPKMTMDKLNKDAIALFRKHARHGKRMSEEELQVSDEELVEKLKLVDTDADCYSDAYVNKLSAIDRGEKIWFDPENGMGNGTVNGTHETINGTVKAQDETVNETIKQNVSQNGTVNGTVNENQIKVLCYIAETSNASAVNMVEDLKISRRTLFRILSFWGSESMGFIEREGSDKTGRYVLTEKGRLYYKEVLQKDNAV